MIVEINSKNAQFFLALGSETRIKIIEILVDESKNIGEIAEILGISSAIVTRHIKMLEEVGIVKTTTAKGRRGIVKNCHVVNSNILLKFEEIKQENTFISETISIGVGQYSNYSVKPTCGLASCEKVIGYVDDERYFSSPERQSANIIWFSRGYLDYAIPHYLLQNKNVVSLEISLEICSEYPGHSDNWPSDIYFYINGVNLGMWTCPSSFGGKCGIYTPSWWNIYDTQYGLLKKICIDHKGTYIDGVYASDTTIEKIMVMADKDMIFRVESPEDTLNPGGVNIIGKGFGNYDQDIEITVNCQKIK